MIQLRHRAFRLRGSPLAQKEKQLESARKVTVSELFRIVHLKTDQNKR